MAQEVVELDGEIFSCPVCLEVLTEPVTLPCGHSHCVECIRSFWGQEDKVHSCPQCGQAFPARPVLVTSTTMAALVEEPEGSADHHRHAGEEDVACDVCTGRKLKASKSCLVCVASFCERHLQPHHHAAPLKKHQLVEPSGTLRGKICPRHDEVLKIFCRTDRQCICYLCAMDQHRGHDTVSAAAERSERQEELDESRRVVHQRIQDAEEDLELLEQRVKNMDVSADKTMEDCDEIFSQMIRLILERSREVKQRVRTRQRAEASRVRELEEELRQEMAELKRTDARLEQLALTEDHNQFLLSFPSPLALSESTHSPGIHAAALTHFEDVTAAVSESREKLRDVLRETETNVSLRATGEELPPPPEPTTRAAFLRCSRRLTLDPNTAHTRLLLSEGNRRATVVEDRQPYSDHPDRFTRCHQVLSGDGLTGRCYWEVEGEGNFDVAVAYENISRGGGCPESGFGNNDKSWSLYCYDGGGGYDFYHNKVRTPESGPWSSRVGVYLDHTAGLLSFYSVSGTRTLLHRVQTSFTQPLHAGVGLYGGSAELMNEAEVTSGAGTCFDSGV